MAENAKEDNINSLCKKYFTPELCEEKVTESKRSLEMKLITHMIKYANYLWGKRNYKNLELPTFTLYNSDPKKEKNDIATKVEATNMAIAICFDSWKKEPLQNINGYAKFFETTFNNELQRLVNEDMKKFTHVPTSVKENSRRLSKECEIRNIPDSDSTRQKEIAFEMGLSNDDYEAVRKWRLAKGKAISFETPVKENDGEKKKLEETIEDKENRSAESHYMEKETGKQILKFINTIFRMKRRDNWWRPLVTSIFYDLLHSCVDSNIDPSDKYTFITRYTFIDRTVYDLTDKPTQNEIANMTERNKSQLSRATDTFLDLCLDSISEFEYFKNDFALQESLKGYLKAIKEKGKHVNTRNGI